MGTWSALGTAGLTMAGGMVKLGTAASALKLASVDNIAKMKYLNPQQSIMHLINILL